MLRAGGSFDPRRHAGWTSYVFDVLLPSFLLRCLAGAQFDTAGILSIIYWYSGDHTSAEIGKIQDWTGPPFTISFVVCEYRGSLEESLAAAALVSAESAW